MNNEFPQNGFGNDADLSASRRPALGPKGKMFVRLGITLAVITLILGSCAYIGTQASGEQDSTGGSLGHAEVSCERAMKNELGKISDVSYTRETDLGQGKFALYGTVFNDTYGQMKFHCDVKDARSSGDTNGTATVEIYE